MTLYTYHMSYTLYMDYMWIIYELGIYSILFIFQGPGVIIHMNAFEGTNISKHTYACETQAVYPGIDLYFQVI